MEKQFTELKIRLDQVTEERDRLRVRLAMSKEPTLADTMAGLAETGIPVIETC